MLRRGGPQISHLFFADDLLLFGEASSEQIKVMRSCLENFCIASGQKVSLEKSRLLVSHNVHHVRASQLSSEACISLTSDLGKYLGVPLLHRRTNRETYDFLLRNSQQRLASWKATSLSFAGRVTLTQSVVASLPTYCMQTMLLLKYVSNKLEKDQRRFIWGADEGGRSYSQVAWNKFCSPKMEGGLGLKHMHEFNKALFMKINWGLVHEPDALWARVLRHKYGCGDNALPIVSHRASESSIWNGVRNTWEDFSCGIRWQIGDGKTVQFWQDRWLASGILLAEVVVQPIPLESANLVVAAFYGTNGNYDTAGFVNLVPNVVF